MRNAIAATTIVGVALLGCSKPDLSGTNFSCTTDADCLDGKVCGIVAGLPACVPPGSASSTLRIGMSGPLQGPSADLGLELRNGITSLFESVNDQGGVGGRKLELVAMNDNYDPTTALANTNALLDIQMANPDPDTPDVRGPNSVLALIANVGTPTMLVTAPVANKNHVVFFAPFTGAQKYLRDGTNSPYVYNYRAGYYEETQAMAEYMKSMRNPPIITGGDSWKHVLAFTQHDTYGDAGYNGFVAGFRAVTGVAVPQPDSTMPDPSIVRVTYEREDLTTVHPAVVDAETRFFTPLLADTPDGSKVSIAVLMIDTYAPGNQFIKEIRDWINTDAKIASKLDVLFIHVSFVGSDALAKALTAAPATYTDVTTGTTKTYAEGVMVTQVVPYYQSQAPGVTTYRMDLAKHEATANTFTSLEGYIAARLLVEAMKAAGPVLTDATLVDALNSKIMNLDLGIGTPLNFSAFNHQASHTVWGSVIGADGKFSVPFIWDPMNGIVPGG
jgi:ABC-type branched-subunit amino acid transport system substrate-binding protein